MFVGRLAICLALLFAFPAKAETIGRRLSEDEVTHLLYGAMLYGEYVDGRPDWAEQTAVTGQLYDVLNDWEEVGRWSVADGMVCYQYFDSGNVPCFDITLYEDHYYFYSAGSNELVAITTRVEREPIM